MTDTSSESLDPFTNNPRDYGIIFETMKDGSVLSKDELIKHLEGVLQCLSQKFKFDLSDPNLTETPQRIAKSYNELLDGYTQDPKQILSKKFPSENYDQMIVVTGIKFHSLCAHHMLPFSGEIAVGYLPGPDGQVVGLSKIPRVCHAFARRLQIQERMTMQIAKAIDEAIKPRGVGVVVHNSRHLCAAMRGVKESCMDMTTSAMLGDFREDLNVKQEFLRLISLR